MNGATAEMEISALCYGADLCALNSGEVYSRGNDNKTENRVRYLIPMMQCVWFISTATASKVETSL